MRRRTFVSLSLALAIALPSFSAGASLSELKTAAEEAVKAAIAAPSDYSANWMAAKACRLYGDEMVTQKSEGWKDKAKVAARDGMKYGDLATKLDPKSPEGWYWYGLNVGTYSDCVSMLTALGEGLKGKTQKSFETAYAIDKMLDNGGPILALGRFWQVLPGIAGRDLKKAEKLFDEYMSLFAESAEANKDAYYFRGSLYKDIGKVAEARADFQKAISMGQKDAPKALADLK